MKQFNFKRKGVIVDKIIDVCPAETNNGLIWIVKFDNGVDKNDVENVPSTALKILKDTRVFKWTAVQDSFPVSPVQPFGEHGVVGFDFEKRFSKQALDINNTNYQYPPYLKLLEHLWPGM